MTNLLRYAVIAVLALAPRVSFSQQVQATKRDVDRAAWSSNAVYHTATSRDPADTVMMVYAYNLFKQNPHMPANLALKDLNTYRENLTSIENEVVEGYKVSSRTKNTVGSVLSLAAASKKPNVAAGAAMTKDFVNLGYEGLEALWHSGTQIEAQRQLLGLRANADKQVQGAASGIWDLAQSDPDVATASDAFFGAQFRANVGDSATNIFDKNPELKDHKAVQDIANAIKPDGSLTTKLDDLKTGMKTTTAELSGDIKENTAKLKDLTAQLNDEWQQQAAAARAQQDFEATRTAISSGAGAVQLISKLMALQDKQLASQFAAIGGAVVDVASAINDYGHDSALLQQQFGDFGTFLGTAALANNLLGAAFSLTGAFSDASGGSLQQMAAMREEIHQIHQEIQDMHAEMRTSFLHIDAKLDAAITLVSNGFNAVLTKLDNVQTDLVSIRQQLIQQAAGLEVLRRDLLQYSKDNLIVPFLSDATQCLGFKSRNPKATLPEAEYDRCVARFLTWGNTVSKTATLSGSTTPVNIYEQGTPILTRSTDEKINFLAGLATQLGMVPAQQQLPNVYQWLSGADSFIVLANQWPDQFKKQSSSPESDFSDVGHQLQSFSFVLSLRTSADGKRIGNYQLFQKLMEFYETDFRAFSEITRNRASAWLVKKYPDVRFQKAILSDFSSDEEIGIDSKAKPCDGSSLNAGDLALSGILVPYQVALKNSLQPDFVTFCYKASLTGTKARPCQSGGGFSCVNTITWGQAAVEVVGSVKWNDKPITVSRSVLNSREFPTASGTYLGPSLQPMITLYDPAGFVSANWPDGEKLANSVNPLRKLTDDDKKALDPVLAEVKKSLYESDLKCVREDLNNYLAGLFSSDADLNEAARRVAISKTLLDDFSQLAFPESSNSDDLRSLFRGDMGLWDRDVFLTAVHSASPLEQLISNGNDRIGDLRKALSVRVAAVEGSSQPEADELVSATLDRLKMLNSLRTAEAASQNK